MNLYNENQAFREELRTYNDEKYNVTKHVICNSIIALMPVVIFGLMLSFTTQFSMLLLLAIPCGIVLGNMIEYIMHRFPMHMPKWSKGSRMYKRHAGQHHRAFTRSFMTVDINDDFAHIMLPTKYAIMFSLVSTIIMFALSIVLLGAFGYTIGIVLSIYFFLEELLHALFHTQWMWQVENIFRPLAEHHRIHHDSRLMRKWNFNILFPLFDYVFRTKY